MTSKLRKSEGARTDPIGPGAFCLSWEIHWLRTQHNPPAIQRDRGATADSEFLPNCVPLTFYGFLTRSKSIAREKDLCCAVTTRTSCDTFGSVVCDISLEVCRVHSHFSELCWGTCCVGDFFFLVESSTRWAPPRFDTRDKDPCLIPISTSDSPHPFWLYSTIQMVKCQ